MELSLLNQINVLTGEPFRLANQDQQKLNELKDYVMEQVTNCESTMNNIYDDFSEGATAWRMQPRKTNKKRPQALFNSVSGETNRAINTLASIWFRMLTAADPYFEAIAEGLGINGQELTESDLYAVETVIGKQLIASEYKRKLLRTLRSLAAFGTVVVEEPFVSRSDIEFTDFNHRSMLLTFFDPMTFDMSASDFIAFMDFPSVYKMRELSRRDGETWDKDLVEKAIKDFENIQSSPNPASTAYSKVMERRSRAGYDTSQVKNNQLITYHGKLPVDNEILQIIWDSEGRQDDITSTDWTMRIYGDQIVSLHPTPYGTWRHHAKVASINEFELEAVGYGVARLGKKHQRELNATDSRMNDAYMLALFKMAIIGKFAGYKAGSFQARPFGVLELEDINQYKELPVDVQMIAQGIGLQNLKKEDFRTLTQASTNLQAAITKATATEASLTQTEAIRGNSVIAEVIAESLVRAHIETSYINNLDLLDKDIYVRISGSQMPMTVSQNRHTLPRGVGFKTLVTSDKNFRPERIKNLLQVVQLSTSIRNIIPETFNMVRPSIEELYRELGMNPRRLNEPIPMKDQISMNLRRMQMMGGGSNNGPMNEVEAEAGDEASGFPNAEQSTPVGPVPTSPNSPLMEAM